MQKLNLLIVAMLMMVIPTQAQNGFFITGNGYHNSSNNDDDIGSHSDYNTTNYRLLFGRMINKTWAGGARYERTYYNNTYNSVNVFSGDTSKSNTSNTTSGYSYGIFVRKFMHFNDLFSVVFHADVNSFNETYNSKYSSGNFNNEYTETSKGIRANIIPTLMVTLNKHWAAELNLGTLTYTNYERTNDETGNVNTGSNTFSNFNAFGSGIGITYYFGSKSE